MITAIAARVEFRGGGRRKYNLRSEFHSVLKVSFFVGLGEEDACPLGMARTAVSSYRSLRSGLGVTRYAQADFLALLAAAGYSGERLPRNMEHNQTRMAFVATLGEAAGDENDPLGKS